MKKRESGFELLRIIMMIQIIFLHLCDKGGYSVVGPTLPKVHYYIYYLSWLLSRCPVYVFMILAGYFLVKKDMDKKAVIDRVKKIYVPMLFFSIVISLLGAHFGFWTFADIPKKKMLTPLLSDSWYFLTGYIILIILSPYLNILVKNLTKKQYRNLLITLFVIFSIWVPFSNLEPLNTFLRTFQVINNNGGKSLYDYVCMYLLGGYLSIHFKDKEKLQFKYLLVFFICGFIQLYLGTHFEEYIPIAGYNSNPFSVIQAICLVLFFRRLKFSSKMINYIATFTLTTYIIHEHYLLKRYYWGKIIYLDTDFFRTYWYPFKIIGICLGVFAFCIVVELIRRGIFKIVLMIYNYLKSDKAEAK